MNLNHLDRYTLVEPGVLQLVINVLSRAGKQEILDELLANAYSAGYFDSQGK